MDEYKNKYDDIINKLLDLIEKEKLLDKVEEEKDKILENIDVCWDDLNKLNDKFYNMKHNVIVDKSDKCLGRAVFFSLISGLMFIYIGVTLLPSLWLFVLYVFLNIIVHYNMYIKKVNDKEFMFVELENSLEYIDLNAMIESKKNELSRLDLEYDRLCDEYEALFLETSFMYRMIYVLVTQEELYNVVETAIESGLEDKIEYALNKRLVRRRVKEVDRKKDE